MGGREAMCRRGRPYGRGRAGRTATRPRALPRVRGVERALSRPVPDLRLHSHDGALLLPEWQSLRACGGFLYERKLNANYYNPRDGQIWHVPGFCAFRHRCPPRSGTAAVSAQGGTEEESIW